MLRRVDSPQHGIPVAVERSFQPQVLEETRLLVEHLDSPSSVFRMNHASNYLVLKGTLNGDREAMLRTIDAAEHDLSRLRPESWRGL